MASDPIQFGVYDPEAEVDVSRRNLPHWFQPGVAVFITFRTADSLPEEVRERWDREQADWLARNVARLAESGAAQFDSGSHFEAAAVPPQLRGDFLRRRSQAWRQALDAGCGECVLRDPEFAEIVAEAVRQFDGTRYDLDSFFIMPNHVHLLVQFRRGTDLRRQCGNWQRYSARQINARLNRRGVFWQSEPFDHLVRSPEQFAYLQNYVYENPLKARLATGSFLYWSRDRRERIAEPGAK